MRSKWQNEQYNLDDRVICLKFPFEFTSINFCSVFHQHVLRQFSMAEMFWAKGFFAAFSLDNFHIFSIIIHSIRRTGLGNNIIFTSKWISWTINWELHFGETKNMKTETETNIWTGIDWTDVSMLQYQI